jgi:WD40 repeat protein
VAYSPDGRTLASGGEDGTIRFWDPATGEPVGEPLTGHRGGVWSVAYSPDGRMLASGGEDGSVRLWDPRTGQRLAPVLATVPGGPSHPVLAGGVTDLSFVPDSGVLAASGVDEDVREGGVVLWNTASGEQVTGMVEGHRGIATGVAFRPGSRLGVSSGEDGLVRFWDPTSGVPVGSPLSGHNGTVTGVSFSPDGRLLATSGEDGLVQLWDPSSGTAVGSPLAGLGGRQAGVEFSPDGLMLASAGEDGVVRLWDVWRVDVACALVRDLVTRAQVAPYAPTGWASSACTLQ